MLKIYNTLGRELQQFEPINDSKVKFYHCGPTVYWTQHIGNLRGMAMGDLIRRSLEYLDYDVEFVRNYTDFGHLTSDADQGEDKMEKGARREGKKPQEIADKYIKIFEKDTKELNIIPPTTKARATDYIDSMIEMVKILLEKGYAYSTPAAIYFDVSKFSNYTELSGRKLAEDQKGAGSGQIIDNNKRNPADFAIWFFKTGPHKNALQYWESPFDSPEVDNGEGFPGWHIECSAMVRSELGDTIDIHMGGVEHISIHHPNEIAQSEAVSGQKFVNYWLHNEHLLYEGGKMSKSLGNVYSLEQITEKGYNPLVLRYFYLQAHYRSKQNFTWEALEASNQAYKRLAKKINSWQEGVNSAKKYGQVLPKYKKQFQEKIKNDFNIPRALAVVWDLVKSDQKKEDKLKTILDFDKVLGLDLHIQDKNIDIPDQVSKLLDQRATAREESNWEKADELRGKIESLGYKVNDTSKGQNLEKI